MKSFLSLVWNYYVASSILRPNNISTNIQIFVYTDAIERSKPFYYILKRVCFFVRTPLGFHFIVNKVVGRSSNIYRNWLRILRPKNIGGIFITIKV